MGDNTTSPRENTVEYNPVLGLMTKVKYAKPHNLRERSSKDND